jgi:dihydrolipoamide dehydrogenase
MFHSAKHAAANHGVIVGNVSIDLAKMMEQKDKAVDGLTKGIEFLFKKNKVPLPLPTTTTITSTPQQCPQVPATAKPVSLRTMMTIIKGDTVFIQQSGSWCLSFNILLKLDLKILSESSRGIGRMGQAYA